MRTLLRLRADATATLAPDGRTLLEEGHIKMAMGPLGPALTSVIEGLRAGTEEDALATAAGQAENDEAILKAHMLLRRLESTGWLERVVVDDDGATRARLRPIGHQVGPPPRALPAGAEAVVSRFATLQ